MSQPPSTVGTGVAGTLVDAATVATTKYSVATAFRNTYGDRYVALTVKCDVVYDLQVLGADTAIASAGGSDASAGRVLYSVTEQPATAKDGKVFYIPIAGQRYVLPVLYQHTGGNAAVTISYQTLNDFSLPIDADFTITAAETVTLGAGTAEIGKLAAGSASIGKLGANSGVDIGDVTINGPLDTQSASLRTIDYAHHEIHDGKAFSCHFNNEVTNTGEMTAIAFVVPAGAVRPHIVCEIESTGPAYFAIYENPDLDVDEGSDLAIWNRDRESANASVVGSIETSPEYGKATSWTEAQIGGATLSTASELMRVYLSGGAAVGNQRSGAAGRNVNEWILDDGRSYAFVMVALTDDTMTHNITLDWYEHTDV